MEAPRFTRAQFLSMVGAGMLSLVAAKVATVENTLTSAVSPAASRTEGYGASAYGGRR